MSAHVEHGVTAGGGGFTVREARQARRLATVIGLVAGFFALELTGALIAGSVALQADALHLLMDMLSLSASWLAMRIAVREPTPRFTFGLRRAEPVAAMLGACFVLATTAFIVLEAVESLRHPSAPRAGWMLAVAVMTLFVNGLSAWLLHDAIGGGTHHDEHADEEGHAHEHHHRKHHGHALNLRSALLHMMGDVLGAVAAIVAALVIRFGGPVAADPIASFVVAGVLVLGSMRLLATAGLVLLEAAPPHLPVATIRAAVLAQPGVTSVHRLHVWTLGAGHDAIALHVRTDDPDPGFGARLSRRISTLFGVEYVTVEVELSTGSAGPGAKSMPPT